MAEPAPRLLAWPSALDPYAGLPFGWYGAEPAFQVRVERHMHQIEGIGGPVARHLDRHRLIYQVPGLRVPGDLDRHDLTIEFVPEDPLAVQCGVPSCDYPNVTTSVRRPRKHENSDGTLCLWAGFDPPARRWHHGQGLRVLVEIVRTHLFLELHWFETGGKHGGEWLIPDVPHGMPHQTPGRAA